MGVRSGREDGLRKLVAALTLALVPGVAIGPCSAVAGDRHHPQHHGFPQGHVFPHRFGQVFPRPFFFHRPFVPFIFYPSTTYVYAAPSLYADPPAYTPPPVVYAQPQPVAAPPPTTPSVIQYATGRYELRGDGISTPYTWVWIPNPPPPPEAPPPPQGRAPDATGSAPPSERASRAPLGEIYHWTDDEGVNYWTDRLDHVPERYRLNARRPKLPEVGS
jgi:hypothetical protein